MAEPPVQMQSSSWGPGERHRLHWWFVPALLALSACLAVSSLVQDSITFDETNHLASGLSYLKTGDLRMSPENPPLARIWAALPVLLMDCRLPDEATSGWREGDVWQWGNRLLCSANDGKRLILPARCQMVVLLLVLDVLVYMCGRVLFGGTAGLLALLIAVFCPTLLAHGRLVTSDLPIALASLLVLFAFSRLGRLLNGRRLCAAMACLAALSVTKHSWILVTPALACMAAQVWFSGNPWRVQWFSRSADLSGTRQKAPALLLVGFCGIVAVYLGIWSCYAWRYSMFAVQDGAPAGTLAVQNPAFPVLKNMEDVWQCALSDEQGRPLQTASVRCIRWAREHRFLPEAYLYGIAYMLKSSTTRPAYLLGEISAGSWRSYYPIAFAIKTPIGMMVLMAIGSALLLIRGGPRSREPVLLIGLLVFVGVYCVAAVSSPLNIGQRHLLSIYPPLIIIAGHAAVWRSSRTGRWILVGGLAGVVYSNLAIWPNYLSYFNEFAGGPKHGHQYLLDSNLDWGQDLARLAEYRSRNPRQNLKLAYFGSVEPRLYGIECEVLPSYLGFEGPAASLTAGTYVVSATQLFGVCEPMARRSFWKSEDGKRLYREATEDLAGTTGTGETDRARRTRQTRRYEYVMSCLLLSNLPERAPDARIGWSLFVYQLSQHDVDTLLRL